MGGCLRWNQGRHLCLYGADERCETGEEVRCISVCGEDDDFGVDWPSRGVEFPIVVAVAVSFERCHRRGGLEVQPHPSLAGFFMEGESSPPKLHAEFVRIQACGHALDDGAYRPVFQAEFLQRCWLFDDRDEIAKCRGRLCQRSFSFFEVRLVPKSEAARETTVVTIHVR